MIAVRPRFLAAAGAVAGLAALACAAPAYAKNEETLQPVSVALAKSSARKAADGIVFRFGKVSAEGADIVAADVQLRGEGNATGSGRGHAAPTDETVCRRAFSDALARFAAAAKAAGATAVVGIVSDYKGDERADASTYECHSGSVHSYVEFKGQLARTVPDDPAFPASGFARVDDVQAVPLSDRGKSRYAAFLQQPRPRAFVVYEDGGWHMSWGRSDAPAAALRHCASEGRRCWLYAVDGQVVWNADVARRIGAAPPSPGASAVEDDNE